MKTTIKDVAKLANVSISTISRVMNSPEIVAPEKRQRVLEAIEQLRYHPNALARGLIFKKTKTIGVLVPDVSNAYYAEAIRGMEDAAREMGHNIILSNTDKNKKRLGDSLQVMAEKRVDGLIFMSEPVSSEDYELLRATGLPLVLAATHSLEYDIPSIKVNDEQAAYDGAVYLIGQGHRRIAMISGRPADTVAGLPRLQGFLRALRDAGLELDVERCVAYGDYRFEHGYEAMKRLHRSYPELTAVFAMSDEMGLGALSYLHEVGVKIPAEVSVLGFDNTRMASMAIPPLTTVGQPIARIGYGAVQKLLKVLDGEACELRTELAHELVVRDSVIALISQQ
ncbi:substrate-binding domain-containing protein [Paenibacillus athensensis]|uniref:LacI family transcriptional regulator n=1 Tax=Paenibacillus athensensis TaxID=1967502 RepID=A0A4Y8Q590_9BACL|nr:substrate-binding domain-containing protein [Paenibacillus athensensis]MCD1259606.1 substrate-binding domain-containing protein [Paenibacillus athensensis]